MVWTLIASPIAVLAGYTLYQSDLYGPLRRVPGPVLAKFTKLWELWALRNGHEPYIFIIQKAHHKYGPVVRLAPGRYSIGDPDEAKKIYNTSAFAKSNFYKVFSPELNNVDLFTDQNIARNAANRRKVASLYSMSTLKSYEPYIDDMSGVLCTKLRELANVNAGVVCLPDWLRFFAFDVIDKITFSHDFGMMEAGRDRVGILSAINANETYGSTMGILAPWLHKFVMPVMSALMVSIGGAKAQQWIVHRIAEGAQVGKRTGPSDDPNIRRDFNQKTLDLVADGKLDEEQRFYTLRNNLGAGSDTTSATLSAIVWYLGQNRNKLASLQEEIRTGPAKNRLFSPITFAEAQSMPYLQAVIKEALRLHPAVGSLLPRVVPAGGTTLCGYYFPAGTVVGSNAWVLNYDKGTFGPDANEFRPERWLESEAKSKRMDGGVFTFSAGARTCVGKNVALLELSKLVPELYRRFDFEVGGERTVYSNFTVSHRFGVRVKVLN